MNSPAWWPGRTTLLFERQDLSGEPVSPPGQEVPRYPSHIERVMADGSVPTLVSEGRFADVTYPQFSPRSDQIVFVAPQSGINGQSSPAPLALNNLFESPFGPEVAYANGIPWDPWLMNADGSGLHRVAEVGGDEPSVAWSPDESQLCVYRRTGSYIVDAASGELTPLKFVQGCGPAIWLNT